MEIALADHDRRQVVVSPDAVFPPALGERVGAIKVTVPGVSLGSSPLLVSEVPPPPATGDGPWWARAAGAVGAGRLIAAQLYGVSFWDPVALSIAAISLMVCAFVAAIIPAGRAASISPIRALRQE